jgi:hypothetical protein
MLQDGEPLKFRRFWPASDPSVKGLEGNVIFDLAKPLLIWVHPVVSLDPFKQCRMKSPFVIRMATPYETTFGAPRCDASDLT